MLTVNQLLGSICMNALNMMFFPPVFCSIVPVVEADAAFYRLTR